MTIAPENLVGRSIEWTGVHHSQDGDFADLSTQVVTYETADHCYVTASGQLTGDPAYAYTRLDDRMAIMVYHPLEYRGRTDVVPNAMFDFEAGSDRAVILAGGEPFAVAEGTMREVPPPPVGNNTRRRAYALLVKLRMTSRKSAP